MPFVAMLSKLFTADSLRKLTYLIIALLFIGFISPLWLSPVNLYSSYTDDFYYYLKIAESFNKGQGLCFTPNIQTNGFQPFYQFFIIGLAAIAGWIGASPLVFIRIALSLLFLGSSLFMLRKVKPKGGIATFIFILGIISYYFISNTGMEVIFIVPVLTWFATGISNKSFSLYKAALLVMIMFFIRIDSFIITLPLFIYYIYDTDALRQRRWQTIFTSFVIMAMPVALYLTINYIFFQSFFPISGLAKTVSKVNGINAATFESFARYFPYNLYNLAIVGLYILVVFTGNFKEKIYLHLLAFAILLFYLQTSLRSDWSLWSWYFYPMPSLALLAAAKGKMLFAGRDYSMPKFNRLLYATGAASVSLMILFSFVLWMFYTFPLYRTSSIGQGKVDILHIAGLRLKEFEDHHTGVYAMGDRAGIVGYLMKSPLIQMEGLVMDKKYMTQLYKTRHLKDLLQTYNVDYYIASNPTRIDDSTFVVKEPFQSKGLSHQITDTIRWNIVDSFTEASKGIFTGKTNDQYETVVFKVPAGGERQSISRK